ncbi:unnamed protein product, partial [Mesorhabditis belari]|uniref:Uncharacterized protein n=1 Tax=Mesorhabditis belari TaxID=2138241 RepID=A0AAF3FIF5_9BILA
MAHTSVFWSNFFTHNDIETTFWFMMAGMDFVTNKNLQKLKRKEMGIVKWAEEMLMWQMLSTSLMNVLIAFFDVPSFISSLFCGPYLTSVIGSFLNLFKNLLYFFVSSILNASLLQKPRQLQKD